MSHDPWVLKAEFLLWQIWVNLYCLTKYIKAVTIQWWICNFPDTGGGTKPWVWGENLLFDKIFVENCKKMKKMKEIGSGGCASLAPPLDPPMLFPNYDLLLMPISSCNLNIQVLFFEKVVQNCCWRIQNGVVCPVPSKSNHNDGKCLSLSFASNIE